MSLDELLAALRNASVALSRGNLGRLELDAMFPETDPLPPALVAECRRRKAELLCYLDFTASADGLLLESSHRLAAAWPKDGPVLTGAEWCAFEDELADIYRRQDSAALADVIARRESFALALFATYTETMP